MIKIFAIKFLAKSLITYNSYYPLDYILTYRKVSYYHNKYLYGVWWLITIIDEMREWCKLISN